MDGLYTVQNPFQEPIKLTMRILDISNSEHSCIIVDEVGMIWDNRNFKNFKPEVRDF